jgi:hypothetical protein
MKEMKEMKEMKAAIKREQNQTCLSYSKREQSRQTFVLPIAFYSSLVRLARIF